MVRLFYFVCFAFIFSCTIIEDSDITSQEELDNLQYVSIEIKQETSGGTSTSLATVTSETEIKNATPTHAVWMSWPALGSSSKLKLKSGTTTAFRSYTSFLESGKPWTFYLFSSGTDSTIYELYSFRYNTKGQLASIITRVPFVNGGPATSNDTLIYDTSGNLLSPGGITRKYPATSTTASFSNLHYQSSDNSFTLSQFTFLGMDYFVPCNGGGGGGCQNWGGNHHVTPSSPSNGFPTGVMNLTTIQREYLSIQDFNSIDQSNCNGNCSAFIDTFYFHPLMILKDHFTNGNDLLFIYMVDWWKPSTPQASTTNEKVIISFNYDL